MLRGDPSWHTSSTGPDVDAELERGCRNDGPEISGAKARLDPEPAFHRKAPVVRLDGVLPEPLAQLMGYPLGHPAGVDEHERRAVLFDVAGDPLEHRRHLLECRHGAELVVRQLDGDVQRPSVTDVDHFAQRLAVGERPVRSGADE